MKLAEATTGSIVGGMLGAVLRGGLTILSLYRPSVFNHWTGRMHGEGLGMPWFSGIYAVPASHLVGGKVFDSELTLFRHAFLLALPSIAIGILAGAISGQSRQTVRAFFLGGAISVGSFVVFLFQYADSYLVHHIVAANWQIGVAMMAAGAVSGAGGSLAGRYAARRPATIQSDGKEGYKSQAQDGSKGS